MQTIIAYLYFNNNCEEAFEFYNSVFINDIPSVSRLKDMPQKDNIPAYLKENKDNIILVSLPVNPESTPVEFDNGEFWSPDIILGNNFSLTINTDSMDECERLLYGLSEGGKVTIALKRQNWGDYYGMLTDKFGVNWMIHFSPPEELTRQG